MRKSGESREPETKAVDFLSGFEQLGITDFKDSGDGKNFRATCPFSDKEGKLYVNKFNGLWDSKVEGISGNFKRFLHEFYTTCMSLTDESQLSELAESRKLPLEAFKDVALNQINGEWLIPQYDQDGEIAGLGRYNGKAVYRTSNTQVHLNYGHQIKHHQKIYVCEGEWDTIALQYILDGSDQDGLVVTVPGAGTFKQEWVHLFKDKDVILCYDYDKAGRAGELKATEKLYDVVSSLNYVNWGKDEHKDGYDLRDLIVENFPKRKTPRSCSQVFEIIEELIVPESNFGLFDEEDGKKFLPKRKFDIPKGSEDGSKAKEYKGMDLGVPDYMTIYKIFDKNLKMVSYLPVDVIMGTMFANRIEGDPIWTLLVAPPGGSKTEFLMTLNGSEWVETTTSLTPASLVSGIKFDEGDDPSLLIKVNNRMLVIKDFTTILSMQAATRDEIFGILRDVYDGYVEKFFGTGVKKSYHSKFGILAGVTPMIDSLAAQHSSLGERFLKFRMSRFESEESEIEKIKKAMKGVGSEGERRDELQRYVAAALRKPMPQSLPQISEEIYDELVDMAMLTAMLRGAVTKDPYSGELLCLPVVEVGTRLSKQMSKLAMGIAIFKSSDKVDASVMDTIRLVCHDTCPDRIAKIVGFFYKETFDKDQKDAWVKSKELAEGTGMSDTTLQRVNDNLRMLGIIKKHSSSSKMETRWCLTDKVMRLCRSTRIFDDI